MNYRLFLRPDAPRWEVAEWNFKSRRWQMIELCPDTHCAAQVLRDVRGIRPTKKQEKTTMPKITKDSPPEDIIRAFGPTWYVGDDIEHLLNQMADAREGFDDSEYDGRLIKLSMIHGAMQRGLETYVKDRHYEATIGVIGENRMVFDGVQFTTVAPSLPKTTPATYVPNAELMMSQFPPHEYPELWTLVPAKTSKGRIGYVACEVL